VLRPLMALGCQDTVERIEHAKAADPHRTHTAAIFNEWWQCHGSNIVTAAGLNDRVQALFDPQARGRQFVASYVQALAGTRVAGFLLIAQPPAGRWNATTYKLEQP
jgi:hypothetical protein